MTLKDIKSLIRSRGITSYESGKYPKVFGYQAFPMFDLTTPEGLQKEKDLALLWMKNNPNNISINYGEGHLWFATMERNKDGHIIWTERVS